MSHPWAEVNAAVLAVLAEWSRPLGRGGTVTAPDAERPAQPEVFADRLLSVRQAEGLVDRGEVRILPGTVVTPLARDLLKRRGVAVRVVSGREAIAARTSDQGEWGFALESARHPGLAAALRRHWLEAAGTRSPTGSRRPGGWSRTRGGGPGRGRRGCERHLAGQPGRRHPRGDGGRCGSTVRAVRHLGANLLVVEPTARSIHLIRQIGDAIPGRWRAPGSRLARRRRMGGPAMRIAEVIGRVTLSRVHPSSAGGPVRRRPPPAPRGAGGRLAQAGRGGHRLRRPRRQPGSLDRPVRRGRGRQPVPAGQEARRRLQRRPDRPNQSLNLLCNRQSCNLSFLKGRKPCPPAT